MGENKFSCGKEKGAMYKHRLVGILTILSEDVVNSFFPPERETEKLNTEPKTV